MLLSGTSINICHKVVIYNRHSVLSEAGWFSQYTECVSHPAHNTILCYTASLRARTLSNIAPKKPLKWPFKQDIIIIIITVLCNIYFLKIDASRSNTVFKDPVSVIYELLAPVTNPVVKCHNVRLYEGLAALSETDHVSEVNCLRPSQEPDYFTAILLRREPEYDDSRRNIDVSAAEKVVPMWSAIILELYRPDL